MKLTSKLLTLLEAGIDPKELEGKTFKVIKSDNKKLAKRKKPFKLVKKFDMLMDSKERFSFAFLKTVVKNKDGMYALRQSTPLSGEITTILQEV